MSEKQQQPETCD